jgi:vacuolar-type H+-ATPase subunit F/Vma7
MDAVVVGDKYLVDVFRLIGIEAVEAENEDLAVARVNELADEGKCKLLIVTEKVAMRLRNLREELNKEKKFYPVLVIIPDFDGPLGERKKELNRLVNRSLGLKLKMSD